MQLIQLENSSLRQKLKLFEKQQEGGIMGNDYNPEFLKLQDDFNEKEREILMLQDRVDSLEQALSEQRTSKMFTD